MSEDKKSKTPGIDSCPAYNTRSQRIESQLRGGKTISEEEKDRTIENLLARLVEKDNEILKLQRELYVERAEYCNIRLDKDKEILQLHKQIILDQRKILMLTERLRESSLNKKVEQLQRTLKIYRKRLGLQVNKP